MADDDREDEHDRHREGSYSTAVSAPAPIVGATLLGQAALVGAFAAYRRWSRRGQKTL
jgi:hypothetical protein